MKTHKRSQAFTFTGGSTAVEFQGQGGREGNSERPRLWTGDWDENRRVFE